MSFVIARGGGWPAGFAHVRHRSPSTAPKSGRRTATPAAPGPWRPALSRRAQKARRCCPSHSPTLRPWIARSAVCATGSGRPSWRRSGARRSPTFRKSAGKSHRYSNSVIYRAETGEGLSLSSGASSRPGVSQAAHHLSLCFSISWIRLRNDEGDPLGSPSREAGMRLASSRAHLRARAWVPNRRSPASDSGQSRPVAARAASKVVRWLFGMLFIVFTAIWRTGT